MKATRTLKSKLVSIFMLCVVCFPAIGAGLDSLAFHQVAEPAISSVDAGILVSAILVLFNVVLLLSRSKSVKDELFEF